jgi:hypothetical protein
MPTVNRTSNTARAAQIIAGIQKHLMSVASMTFNSVAYTPASLIALFQSEVDSAGNVGSKKGQWHDAITADQNLRKLISIVLVGLRELVRQMFTDAQVLADFGFTPRKPRKPLTPAEKVVAAAKRAATRKARNTMGPKAKLDIKGTLTGPVVIEPTPGAPVVINTPAAPAPAASAPAVSSGNGAPPQSPPAPASPASPASPGNGSAPAAPHA